VQVADELAAGPEFERYVARERRAGRLAGAPRALDAGGVADTLAIGAKDAGPLAVAAARRASGLVRPSTRSEVVWVDGQSELAVGVAGVRIETGDGIVVVTIPTRCDQAGAGEVAVTFAVGDPARPAGLVVTTQRRPRGPALVVDTWGDALLAFAWEVLVGLVSGLAGAVGKDARGNRLVPVELAASPDGLAVVPVARHRFSGSIGAAAPRG
jgi:hypothetical protein